LRYTVPGRPQVLDSKRRDGRVVEGARLESEAGQQHRSTARHLNAHAISDLTLKSITRCASVNLDVLRGFESDVSQSYHNRCAHLRRAPRCSFVLVESDTWATQRWQINSSQTLKSRARVSCQS
jgi:hypothetical protein